VTLSRIAIRPSFSGLEQVIIAGWNRDVLLLLILVLVLLLLLLFLFLLVLPPTW
jgi:hypothetical protein